MSDYVGIVVAATICLHVHVLVLLDWKTTMITTLDPCPPLDTDTYRGSVCGEYTEKICSV